MELKHFKLSEFDSPDLPGSGKNMNPDFLKRLDEAREIAGVPFKINSGFRTEAHNTKVNGKPNSSHLRGYAADIHCHDPRWKFKILDSLLKVGFDRIGIYKTFIHVDCDPQFNEQRCVIW
jgi:uncharacterized protein YcbK (DUF882 family)